MADKQQEKCTGPERRGVQEGHRVMLTEENLKEHFHPDHLEHAKQFIGKVLNPRTECIRPGARKDDDKGL